MALVESIAGPMRLETVPAPAGDPAATSADLGPTTEMLGWAPSTSLADGLAAQGAWHHERARYETLVDLG